jgi:hypothetical protein
MVRPSNREIMQMGRTIAEVLKIMDWPKEFADDLEKLYWKVHPPKERR